MKRVFTLVLALCMVLSLCACSGNGGGETTASTTAPIETTQGVQETTAPVEQGGYTAKIVDEGGNPVAGALVQICLDSCFPTMTDENGVASWPTVEEAEGYKISFLKLPEGYDYVDGTTEFYYASGSTEITITLKAVA